MLAGVENHGIMPAPQKPFLKKFYLSEWLARLGRRPVDLARHLGVTESYVSNLRSEKKKTHPSRFCCKSRSFWALRVNDLFEPPPRAASIEQLKGYSPGAIEKLLSAKPLEDE